MTIPIRLREPKVEMKHKPHIMDVSIFEYLKNSKNVFEKLGMLLEIVIRKNVFFHRKYPFLGYTQINQNNLYRRNLSIFLHFFVHENMYF